MKTKDTVRMAKMAAVALAMVVSAQAQTLLISNIGADTVGLYDATTGATINSSFISGLSGAYGVAHDSSYVYVTNINSGVIGKYDLTTGAAVSASFISSVAANPTGIAYNNGVLYVASLAGTVASYDANTGAVINASLITGLGGTRLLEVYNGNLYVGDFTNNTIGLYQLDGTVINSSFISISNPGGITFSGLNLLATTAGGNTVEEFNALTGQLIDANFINSGLSNPLGMATDQNGNLVLANVTGAVGLYTSSGALINGSYITDVTNPVDIDYVAAVPEPGALAMLATGLGAVVLARRKRLAASSTQA